MPNSLWTMSSDPFQHQGRVSLPGRVDEDVGRKRLHLRGQGPDVDIVDEGHALHVFDVAAKLLHVYMLGVPSNSTFTIV